MRIYSIDLLALANRIYRFRKRLIVLKKYFAHLSYNYSQRLTLFSVCFVCFLFVSVQSKHRNYLFRYLIETTETNVLF
jgi:hypothetical protein